MPTAHSIRSGPNSNLAQHSVDDLTSTAKLEEYVEQSQAMLILLGSPKYFRSKNCLREVAAAKMGGPLPLVRIHEVDPTKNGALLDTLEIICPRKYEDFLFPDDKPPISWHRLREFQLVSLSQIAEQLLLASPRYKDVDRLPLILSRESGRVRFKSRVVLFYSSSNIGAETVVQELKGWCSKSRMEEMVILTWGSAYPEGEIEARFLLYLNRQTFVGHAHALAEDVRAARRFNIPVTLVHENDPMAGGCAFDTILKTTPYDLIEDHGLYEPIAVAWHPPPYREVSIRLVVQDLGAQEQAWYRQWAQCCVSRAGKCLKSDTAVNQSSSDHVLARSRWPKLRKAVRLFPRRVPTANATLLGLPDSPQLSIHEHGSRNESQSALSSARALQDCGL